MKSIAYYKEEFLPLESVRISPLDRGYLLGDGVYEVIPVYGGRLFRLDEHLARLERSLEAIGIANPLERAAWQAMLRTLVERNGGDDQSVYFQVTRGEAPRNHAFPEAVEPVVFAMSKPAAARGEPAPVTAVCRPDNRWGRCDIKAIALLPNVLLRQAAVAAGAGEAILLRGGRVTEGAASNVFAVSDGVVKTPPKGPEILAGITRDVVLELASEAGCRAEETDILEAELRAAAEIWVTSSTMEISPVVCLDGRPVGSGEPGPLWRRIYARFRALKHGPVRTAGTETV